jgi:hypothetical protein
LSVFSLYLLILNDLFCLSVFLTVANTGNWQRRSKIPIVPGAPHGVKNAFARLFPPDDRQTNRREDRQIYIPIHDHPVPTLGKDAVAYLMVTKYARSAQFSRRKEAIPPEAPDAERSPVDEAILTVLAEFPFPFSSVRELSRRICLPRSTVHRPRHLTQSVLFTGRHLRWVPHFLTEEHKQIRIQMAIELLHVLSVQSTRQWHDIVTLDESWIDLFSEHDLMWTAPGGIVVDRERRTVQSPKFMLKVVCNPIGFHVLKALPKGRKFNAQ